MIEIENFDKRYNKLNNGNDEDDYLEFVWDLMKTPFTEYHYSLITKKNTNKKFRSILWSRFDEHNDAEEFLLNKLYKNIDIEFQGDIIFYLGKIIDLRHGKEKDKVMEYVKENVNNPNENIRENSIIVIGWLGGNKEIDLLGNILLNDSNNKCRSWAASSFMQISFRKKLNLDKVLPYLYKSIQKEEDYFVIESIINVLQEITKKKFGLNKKDMNINNTEAVEKSKIKALKYFKTLYE